MVCLYLFFLQLFDIFYFLVLLENMNTTRPCGCKGRRTCLICEKNFSIQRTEFLSPDQKQNSFVYCLECCKSWPGWNCENTHPTHQGDSFEFNGVYIATDFITPQEEQILVSGIKENEWTSSQSGRRKQNYGPKCNFKKRKVQVGLFRGFPTYSKFIQDRFEEVNCLKGYQTVEQCTLEYDEARGACIDPHIDDCWIWGERIITLNLLSDSVLTMTKYTNDHTKYNLGEVNKYSNFFSDQNSKVSKDEGVVVRIPMPRRSLLVLYGNARYNWEHSVLREDINEYRLCLTYREFTPTYLTGSGFESVGKTILSTAKLFW